MTSFTEPIRGVGRDGPRPIPLHVTRARVSSGGRNGVDRDPLRPTTTAPDTPRPDFANTFRGRATTVHGIARPKDCDPPPYLYGPS